ncbi:hypothetical protein SAMN04487969_1056 [Paenibacillus algorifonticola]|uniref:Uncharacterized protein n=1 Tax=Paenibacillus algorifonticola TaxID=684063 RepID=A0A1I2CD41_9BACL|nr:hypothetical protein [Paenibacillus algorifonticola]SFE66226.1 hypothetical protein SAMN04487969_1056 [Paenibacillus algorifonticola]
MKKTLAASMLMISIMFSSTLASNAAADNLNRQQGNQSSIASAQPDGAEQPASK